MLKSTETKKQRQRLHTNSKPVSFRLPSDVVAMADAAARNECLTRSKLVERILRAALDPAYGKRPKITAIARDLFA
jgi:metal-responsive CopG/Arc/MetJ family transcriptional regulator